LPNSPNYRQAIFAKPAVTGLARSADHPLFAPGDNRTPALMGEAHSIIKDADPEAVTRWIELGKSLMQKAPEQK